ncbi:hypothetical protein B0A48_17249 [Cryoendolithus antarcticus]|uniref:Uncharacterized protein n=1 Tax=Cryoendolithus antarcticus TaxID=1507870 RepID=A0A1V8SDC3_9PEZI|nr:hypothetical protein B0A48_17249 [Cryoendolithus antarcticus]
MGGNTQLRTDSAAGSEKRVGVYALRCTYWNLVMTTTDGSKYTHFDFHHAHEDRPANSHASRYIVRAITVPYIDTLPTTSTFDDEPTSAISRADLIMRNRPPIVGSLSEPAMTLSATAEATVYPWDPTSPMHSLSTPSAPYETKLWTPEASDVTRRASAQTSTATPFHPTPMAHPVRKEQNHRLRPTVALPGTMSSRAEVHLKIQIKPKNESGSAVRSPLLSPRELRRSSRAYGVRVKNAVKNMFKKDEVDEESFERIDGKHWADERW